ncbi:MAG: SpoIIE family protein phosphatase [Solidesulfovibrio sp. DCME]|uniref:SpoIIE family protein phosphatase n=1 Tax=Solidesulfovibrio sp. DCME TaxID=3447380 RepID=UPI003D111BAF
MRIRSKFLVLLLAMVIIPLVALGLYAWRQTGLLGRELAQAAALALERNASKELAQTVDMISESCADTLDLLETSLSLTAREAVQLLSAPSGALPSGPIILAGEYDNPAFMPELLTDLPGTDIRATYDGLAFHLAPGLDRQAALPQMQALSGILPFYKTLFARHKNLILFGYVGLASGLHCAYPGHGGYPPDYDPRQRPWYQHAAASTGITWDIMTDAITRQVMATMALGLRDAGGRLLGVAGCDIPMGAIFPQSDLSGAWTDDMRAMIVSPRHNATNGQPELAVVACRDYAQHNLDWTAPVALERLESPDTAALGEVRDELAAGRTGVRRLSYRGQDTLLAFAPIGSKGLAVVLAAPRDVVVADARKAENRVLAAVSRMLGHIGWFVAAAVVVVAAISLPASRSVTRPVMELAAAARKLASGDFSTRVTPCGQDEIGELARSFNDMAPQLLERVKLKNDMALAMEVQQNLLPGRPPSVDGLDVAALSLYCDETGGDYFDFLEFSQDDAAHADVVVGDVTGHGVSAALFMATGRALLRGRALDRPGPAALLTEVNDLLCQDTHMTGRFITLFFLRLDLAAKEILWCRAGHDPGLLYDPAGDSFEQLMGPGIPLGAMADWEYAEQRRGWFTPGQVLVLYTDGIHEARDGGAGDGMYGKERMEAIIRREAAKPASAIVNALVADLREFKAGAHLEDDVTLVVIKATA